MVYSRLVAGLVNSNPFACCLPKQTPLPWPRKELAPFLELRLVDLALRKALFQNLQSRRPLAHRCSRLFTTTATVFVMTVSYRQKVSLGSTISLIKYFVPPSKLATISTPT